MLFSTYGVLFSLLLAGHNMTLCIRNLSQTQSTKMDATLLNLNLYVQILILGTIWPDIISKLHMAVNGDLILLEI